MPKKEQMKIQMSLKDSIFLKYQARLSKFKTE